MPSILQRLLILLTTLAASSLWALNVQDLPPEYLPSFQIPKTDMPPTIDGKLAEGEWRKAVCIGGTVNQDGRSLLGRPDAFYLSWDDGHLYMAVKVWMDAACDRPVIKDGRAPGLAFVYDEGLELGMMPRGKNLALGKTESMYKWFLNALGYGGDYSRIAVGQQFKNWVPDFQVATSITEPGTAPEGGRWWIMELSSTPQDFELTGNHRVGDEWHMLLGINHFTAGWMQAVIPINGPYLNPDGHCRAVLVDAQTPIVQETMPEWRNLRTSHTMNRRVSITNPSSKPVAVTIDYGVVDSDFKGSATLDIAPGATAEATIDETLPDGLDSGLAYLLVNQGKTRLFTYGFHFKTGEPITTLGRRATPKGAFPLVTSYNPVANNLLVQADTYYLPDGINAASLQYSVIRQADGAAILTGSVKGVSLWYMQDLIDLPTLKPGKYDVSVTMTLDDGTILGPTGSVFEKQDEATVYADWWDKPYDDIKRVIPPFTAMTREGDTIGVWGRSYQLGALGLPSQILSQGKPVMAAPARIVATIGGQDHVLQATGKSLTYTETEDYRVSFNGSASLAGLSFAVKGWIEQDGLCYLQLTYANAGDTPLTIDALRLEFPLANEDAQCLYSVGPGENYSSRVTKILPTDTQGLLWSTHETGAKASQMAEGSFYPEVWIGNDLRGFLWWGDNDQGWVPNDNHPAHAAERRGDAVVLINNLISEPYELSTSHTVTFSYNASPFRPLVKGWRHFIATEDGTFFGPHRKTRKDSKTGKMVNTGFGHINWIHPESRYPEEWDALWAEQKVKADKRVLGMRAADPYAARSGIHFGHISFQIMRYGRKTADNSLYKYFGDEWEARQETFNSSLRRYCLWLFERGIRDGGYYTTYWDLNFPILFDSMQSGLAYRLPSGRVQPGYNGFNLRRFYMGLYALADQYGIAPGAIGVHSTNSYILVAAPWNDAILDGEYGFLRDGAQRDWVDQFPIERMRTLAEPHNWGTVIDWMNLVKFSDKEKKNATVRSAVEYLWLYDSWRNPYMFAQRTMPESVLDWGLTKEGIVYHPFWRNPHVKVVKGGDNVLVSTWQWDDRIMLHVYNYNNKKQVSPTIEVDLAAFNLVPELVWQEAVQARDLYKDEDAKAVSFNANTGVLSFTGLQPHRGRIIGIRRY